MKVGVGAIMFGRLVDSVERWKQKKKQEIDHFYSISCFCLVSSYLWDNCLHEVNM